MKRSTKQLLSMLLAIVMVIGLMVPAMAAKPVMGEVAETPVAEAETPAASRPTTKAPAKAGLSATKLTYAAAIADVGTTALAAETKITSGDIDAAVSLYVGPDTYKTGGDKGYFEGQTNCIVGNANPVTADDAVDADGNPTGKKAAPAPLTTADGNHFPVTGCYYKFVAHKAGALEVVAMMNADKSIFVFDAGTDGTTATAINGKDGTADTKLSAKGDPFIEKFEVAADHTYYVFCTGSKAGLYGFTFEEGATVDTTPVITISSPAEATTKEVKQNEGLAIAVAATISFKPQSAIQYQWYKKGTTDTAIEGATKESLTIDTANVIEGDQYYCVVSAEGATSVTSPVITVKVNKADPVEEEPEATATEWVANLADIPGTAITVDGVDGKETTAETVVNAKVMGITFSVGADKYKMLGAEGDIPASLTGKTNPAPSPKTGVPTSGTYYKFAMTMDGELTINNVANKKNVWVYDIDENGTATAMEGYNPLACDTTKKFYDPFTIEVKKGHTYVMAAEGSKAIIAGFSFNPVIEGSWTANLADIPGTAITVDGVDGKETAAETVVDAKVPGVTMSVGADKYKMLGAEGDIPASLTGKTNPAPSPKTGVPTSGTYYKFAISMDGELTINNVANKKNVWVYDIDENGTATAMEGYNPLACDTTKKFYDPFTIAVQKGHTYVMAAEGSKAIIAGFGFSSGKTKRDTKPWTATDICDGKTITVTPVVNADGTIDVTVENLGVGEIKSNGVLWTYADELAVEMYSGTQLLQTATTTLDGMTHKLTFTPAATGSYTFKAVAKRASEAATIDSEMSAAVSFILPLAKPAISSVSSNGAGDDGKVSVTVMWGAAAETETYKIFVKETSATAWPADATATVAGVEGKATYSYAVTGLTAGTSYDFKITATRGSETTESDPKTAVAEAKKVTPWTEVTFGTSSTKDSNSIIGGPEDKGLKGYQGASKTSTVNTDGKGSYATEFKDPAGNVVKYEFTGLTGDLNTDPEGRVLLSSRDGAGKIKENEGADGLLFYYTPIPAGTNYTLEADVEVLRWESSNTQNGVGLVAMDRVETKSWEGSSNGNSHNFWDNIYLVGATRTSFSYDKKGGGVVYSNKDVGYDAYTKYSYYMGLMSVAKYGIPVNPDGSAYNAPSNPEYYYERRFPLDTRIPLDGRTVSEPSNNRFNLIGNYTTKPHGFSQSHTNGSFMKDYELTKFHLVIQKNNTGYISTAYKINDDGTTTLLGQNIDYFVKGAMDLSGDKAYHDDDTSGRKDIESLQCLDKDFEYVGLFTSREMDALFTNVKLTTIAPEDDAPAVAPPTTYITPNMSIASGDYSNSPEFNLSVTSNVEGTITVVQNGATLPETYEIKYNAQGLTDRKDIPVTLTPGNNSFEVTFQPDPDQKLAAFTALSNTETITKDCQVKYETYFSDLNNIYVSPTGNSLNYGTKNSPVDVYTAVSAAKPGQNIILLPGVYNLTRSIRINRGMDGTAEKPIYFFADPDRAEGEKVVLNGQRQVGTILAAGSDHWIFKDFEVVGSTGTAFLVAGSYNIVQNVKTHDNLSSGLEIARLSGSDHIPVRPTKDQIDGDLLIEDWGDWPCYNQIINCESYRNYDAGYDGADGFCAKQTCGIGNVFDGCAAYWNADDGWDFYAKTAPDMGPIGRTTIRNCVSFQNGYEVRDLADPTNFIPNFEEDGYNAKMNLDESGKVILIEAGNGNGFKMGGSHLPGAHRIENSYSFYNKAKGFDSNNGPDIKVVGCTAYNNTQENVGLGSSWSPKNYLVEKTVSFKDENAPIYIDKQDNKIEKMKDATPLKDGDTTVYDQTNFFTWDGKKSANMAGTKEVTKDAFVSLEFDSAAWANGAIRDTDGTLALGDFLKMKDDTLGAGAKELVNGKTEFSDTTAGHPDVESKPVETPEIVADPEPSIGGGVSGGSGAGGTIGDKTNPVDKPDDNKPADEKTYTADKKTDAEGNTEIVVKAEDGEVVADVKIPATIPAPETKFDDVPADHWAEESINNMAALGIVKGVGGNTYDMDSAVTRGTIATMLYRFANGKEGKTNPFTDVAGGKWYTDAIAWAADSGVVTGYSETTFGPDDTITREQLAVMLYRFAKLIGMDGATADSALANYNDAASVDDWAAEGMAWCVEKGIINGVSADTLSPDTSATRAQTATMLNRFIGLMK